MKRKGLAWRVMLLQPSRNEPMWLAMIYFAKRTWREFVDTRRQAVRETAGHDGLSFQYLLGYRDDIVYEEFTLKTEQTRALPIADEISDAFM